ncbi:tripartite tricarboxylate transporter TctB family protein [Ramlibacter sp. PS3R-8]|uniref:tripartite tricarboxylate transporter TctB family protein n=1 Tax=Ramlibacter sp. PS3R-8 TaxID=3133437 RepID=UPI00309E0EA2
MTREATSPRGVQTLVGAAVVLTALGLAFGALRIPGEAGYGGVGPNFLPWVVAAALLVCGILIVREARTGGFREMAEPSGGERAWWPGVVWVSAGMLANAALITTIGFILGCTLCYLLAVQGLRRAQGERPGPRTMLVDIVTGLAISAPVFWLFTKFLAINLPGLTGTGWI